MSNQDVSGLLGLAARARKISCGEPVFAYIRNGQAKLVILSEDLGNNTRKKLIDKCTFYQVPYVFLESSDILSNALGYQNRKYAAVLDSGFAKKLATCLKG